MPNISVPTDNLYKFCAISGLFIFIISMLVPDYFRFVVSEKRGNVSIQDGVLILREKFLERDFEKFLRRFKNVSGQLKLEGDIRHFESIEEYVDLIEQQNPEKLKELEFKRLQALKKEINQIEVKQRELHEMSINVDHAKLRIEFYDDIIATIKIYKFFGILLGLALSCFGFFFWYSKIQKYEDRNLRKQHKLKKQKGD